MKPLRLITDRPDAWGITVFVLGVLLLGAALFIYDQNPVRIVKTTIEGDAMTIRVTSMTPVTIVALIHAPQGDEVQRWDSATHTLPLGETNSIELVCLKGTLKEALNRFSDLDGMLPHPIFSPAASQQMNFTLNCR